MWFVRNGDVVRLKVDFLQRLTFKDLYNAMEIFKCMCDCVLVVYTPYLLLVIDDMYSCW